jgi:hypothetical protein
MVQRRAGWPGFDSRQRKISLFSTAFRPALGPTTQPPIQWVAGALSWGVKRQGREADHSPPSRSRMVELCLHSPIRLHGVVLN